MTMVPTEEETTMLPLAFTSTVSPSLEETFAGTQAGSTEVPTMEDSS